MGFSVKELKVDPLVINLQPWLLKKNLAKKNNNLKGLFDYAFSLFIVVLALTILVITFVKYRQSNHIAMYDGGFNTAVFFSSHSALPIKKKENHG